MDVIKVTDAAQLASLIGIMRAALRDKPTCGQSLRQVERDGVRYTLGVARTGHVSLNYGFETPTLPTAKAWRQEADKLNIGPVE